MDAVRAYQAFWSGFDIPAYDENTVPKSVKMPYITYESAEDYLGESLSLSASIWYRDYSWLAISAKMQEIADRISRGGKMLRTDDGAIWIRRSTPWGRRMDDPEDDAIRRIILNVEVEYIR